MNYFIIGASGLIGTALYKRLKESNRNVIGTFTKNSHDNLIYYDMSNKDSIEFLGTIKSADVVYLLSAYSNPSWIFDNPKLAYDLNVDCTKYFIDQLKPINPKIVFMSSVEVFDGKVGNYSEESIPNPLNQYGKMKLIIEKYLESSYQNSTIVRTGWNVGFNMTSRCVVKLTYESLLKPNAKMATDNTFSISSVEDTAEGLMRVGIGPHSNKCHICSDEIVHRTQLAKLIMSRSKQSKKMDFNECLFKDIPYSEPRARFNNLDNRLSKMLYSMDYQKSVDIISKKIDLIDTFYGY